MTTNVDVKAGKEVLKTLDKPIVEENDLLEQIFAMNKTTLFLIQVFERPFIHKESNSVPGFKAFDDILLGGRVAGCKLKPVMIWHSEGPWAFTHMDKDHPAGSQ